MRYIQIDEVALPVGWEQEALEARNAVEATDPAGKTEAIKARERTWGKSTLDSDSRPSGDCNATTQ